MKVQALSNGYYCDQRIRKGDIFELKERKGTSKDEKGKKIPCVISAESQFSELWMRKVEPGQEPLKSDEDDIDLPGIKLKKIGKKRSLSDVGDSVI